jgi:hypothetical protein
MSALLPALTRLPGRTAAAADRQAVRQVIERARWAPSGDNTQPWSFLAGGGASFTVIGRDTRDGVVYDRDGRASQFSLGALLENVRLAANEVGRVARIARSGGGERDPRWQVTLLHSSEDCPDPLAAAITRRCTNRRPFSTRAIPRHLLDQLAARLGPGQRAHWLTGGSRLASSWLMAGFGWVRLASRECYEVHRHIIDWDDRCSPDRLPVASLPLDPATRRLMRWALGGWGRAALLARLGLGTQPRWQLDLLPCLASGAHLVVTAEGDPDSLEAQIAAGAAVQRLWLAASAGGLQLQPLYTPVVLGAYVRSGRRCFADGGVWRRTCGLVRRWDRLIGPAAPCAVFAARLGFAPAPGSRSTRLPPAMQEPAG